MSEDTNARPGAASSGLPSLIVPCTKSVDPARPDPPSDGRSVGVAISGGGFRATLTGLGVLMLLDDVKMLPRLRFVSSVSGGTVAAAQLATKWGEIREGGDLRKLVVDPIVERVSTASLKMALVSNVWRTVGPTTRTDVLARLFDEWWFDDALMEHLDPQVRWVFNAANATTGVRFTFERDVVGDYVTGRTPMAGTGIRVATAAAASAAVPGLFPPLKLPAHIKFPCERDGERQSLVDGGAYDNTGLEVLDSKNYDDVFTVVVNAGGIFTVGASGHIPIVRDLQRANSMLYRQSTTLRTRSIVPLMKEYGKVRDTGKQPSGRTRPGLLFDLGSNVKHSGESERFRQRFAEHRTWTQKRWFGLRKARLDLSEVPTVFDRLDRGLCNSLLYRGWWLAGASLAAFHPELIDVDTLTAPPHE